MPRRPVKSIVGAGVAACVVVGLALGSRDGARPIPPVSATADATSSASAARAPSSVPPPRAEPCSDVLGRVLAGLGADDGALSDAARDALFQDARTVGRAGGGEDARACRRRAFDELGARSQCGRAEAAIAAGLVGAAGVDPSDVRALVASASAGCAATFAEASGFAAGVDVALADVLLERARRDPDDGVRRSAWLAFGSLGEIAERTGAPEVRARVEATLSVELATARGRARVVAAGAAGNAGCRPCLGKLLELARSDDPEVRRTAVAAVRFHDDPRAPRAACEALDRDREPSVRDLAAWALSFRVAHPEVRVPCLYRAALGDASGRVRASATQALAGLSDELAPAYAALIQLTAESAPPDVRDHATRLLATDPSRLAAFDERRSFEPSGDSAW